MKKTVVTLLTLCFGATAFAQLNSSGEGFYRVMSSLTMRYMALQSNRFTIDRSSTPPMVDMNMICRLRDWIHGKCQAIVTI